MDASDLSISPFYRHYLCAGMTILALPTEILQYLLVQYARPSDAAAFTRTCHTAAALFTEFHWKDIFLKYFDPPSVPPSGQSWQSLLARNWSAQVIAQRDSTENQNNAVAIASFVAMLKEAKPHTEPEDSIVSKNVEFVKEALEGSAILNSKPQNAAEANLLSHLRCMTGFTVTAESRSRSRSYVYTLANYPRTAQWGPSSWLHIEHIATVMLGNLSDYREPLLPPFDLDSSRGLSAPGPYAPHDWAGVEGTWMRYICFMHHRDLYTFNYTTSPLGSLLSSIFFERPGFMETTTLLQLKLKICSPDKIARQVRERVVEEDPTYPTLCFDGTSSAGSRIEGVVAMDQNGTAHWHFDAIGDAGVRWSSFGRQIGSRASASGYIGAWTSERREEDDPLGPFWMWKVAPDMSTPSADTD